MKSEIPESAKPYNKTDIFTHKNTPGMMMNNHKTRMGVWAKIVVEQGKVQYEIADTGESVTLTPDNPGIVEPLAVHRIKPEKGAKFYLQYYR